MPRKSKGKHGDIKSKGAFHQKKPDSEKRAQVLQAQAAVDQGDGGKLKQSVLKQPGRRLGGKKNGGVEGDEELRRARLKAIARLERRQAASSGQDRHAAPGGGAPPASAAGASTGASAEDKALSSLANMGIADEQRSEPLVVHGSSLGLVQQSGGGQDLLLPPHQHLQDDAFRKGLERLSAEIHSPLTGEDPARASLHRFQEAVSTLRVLVRNARERSDRRLLRCANDKVWHKVLQWSEARNLLVLAGFSLSPPPPCATGSMPAEEEAAATHQRTLVEEWRLSAVAELLPQDIEVELLQALETVLGEYMDIAATPGPLALAPHLVSSTLREADEDHGASQSQGTPNTLPRSTVGGTVAELLVFLDTYDLGMYAERLLAQGYDNLGIILGMSNEDFQDMCDFSQVLPGHRLKFIAAIEDARSKSV
mmetsp:Transcript_15538/g.45947  ORF Transcript_15538/g.45947 Transcript_15538/m.45947 type:complete len:424 (-) Transcript_15538:96-1367(-)